jgi:hypothetical protein
MSLTGGKFLVKQFVAVRVGLVCRTFGFNHGSLNPSLNHAIECCVWHIAVNLYYMQSSPFIC